MINRVFPGGPSVKNLLTNAGHAKDVDSIPTSGRFPWRRKWQPTPVFMPGKSHGPRSLVGYSPWGCKESDMTEQLHFTMINLDTILKSRDITLPAKVHLVKTMVFPVVMYGCELDCKES